MKRSVKLQNRLRLASLLADICDAQQTDRTAIGKPLRQNIVAEIESLLAAGVDFESKFVPNKPAQNQINPLILAIRTNRINLVKMMLDAKAKVTVTEELGGITTPLHEAVRLKNETIIDLLMKHEADINAAIPQQGKDPFTALDLAIETSPDEKLPIAILSHGEDNLSQHNRARAHELACARKFYKVTDILEKGYDVYKKEVYDKIHGSGFAISENMKRKPLRPKR